jgi:hypothetical protein
MKQDLSDTKTSMKEDMKTNKTSFEKEISEMRKDMKKTEEKTNTKLNENISKLDTLLAMFSNMNNNKDDNKATISGKKRDLHNRSAEMIQFDDKKESSFIFQSETNPFPNISFFNNLPWRGRTNTGISDMEIHDSQYIEDQSFKKCNNIEYLERTEINK